jgi:hypothetical protein
MKPIISIIIIILLNGCNTATTITPNNYEIDNINGYRIACDEAIAAGTYNAYCDWFLLYTKDPPYILNEQIASQRQQYMEQKEADRKRKIKAEFSIETLTTFDDKSLCLRFNKGVKNGMLTGTSAIDSNIKTELIKRGFTADQLKKARKGIVNIGSPTCMLYASWGQPEVENRSVRRNTIDIQHVYRGNNTKNTYFYSENGVITSWQD